MNSIENNDELRKSFLTDEDYSEFCARYRSDKRVKKCVENETRYQRKGQFLQAMTERKKLEDIARDMIRAYIEQNAKNEEKIDLCKLTLSPEDKEKLAKNAVAICMCSDMIESFCMDIRDMLKKYGQYDLVQFLSIEKLLKEAQKNLRWVESDTDLRKFDSWGKACDFYIDSIPKKAQKLIDASDARKERAKKKK